MISLITTFYNWYDRYLDQWVTAVLESTDFPDEIILLISGDSFSVERVKAAEAKIKDKIPYKIVRCQHKGMGHARNKAVEAASGDWIMHLNVDDVIMPKAIEETRKAISDDYDVVIGNMEWIGHARFNGIKKYNLTLNDLMQGRTNDHAMYRKAIWKQSPYIEYSGDVDVAFWIGLAHLKVRIGYVDSTLTKHFFREDTVFGRYSKEDMQEIRRMMLVWQKEGVHIARFEDPAYQIKGDYGFSHQTESVHKELSIIMAYRPDGGIRDQHMSWTLEHFRKMFPDAEIIIEKDTSKDRGWDTFNKSKLLNRGVARSRGKVLFITDIDMVFIKNKILGAVEKADQYSIIFPYDDIFYLGGPVTHQILNARNDARFPRPKVNLSAVPHKKRSDRQANGSYVLTRENYDKAGGHDERFVGWGSEDSAFIKAVTTMIELPFLRMSGPALHLWHPTKKDRFEKRDASIKSELMTKYFRALDDKEMMAELIRENR